MSDVSGIGTGSSGGLDWFKYRRFGRKRVLLREPERCLECGYVFISLYPLGRCLDHDGLEEI